MKDYTNEDDGVNPLDATNAMRVVLPEKLRTAIHNALSDPQFVGRFETLPDNREYEAGFLMARRLQKVLLYAGVDIPSFDPVLFESIIENWCLEFYPGMEWDTLQFNLEVSWKRVKIPEGETSWSMVCYAVAWGKFDGELDPDIRIGPPAMQERAVALAALIRACSETMRKPYLTSRQAASVLKCDRATVTRLLTRLQELGVFTTSGRVHFKKANHKSTPILKWVPLAKRPKIAPSDPTDPVDPVESAGMSPISDIGRRTTKNPLSQEKSSHNPKTETRSRTVLPETTPGSPDYPGM